MSTTTPSSASPNNAAHAAQASARPGAPGQRKPGAQDAADLFASMLSLLSATDDTPALPLIGDVATEPPADLAASPQAQSGDATLMAMMQWAGLPQAGGVTRAPTATGDTGAALAATGATGAALAATGDAGAALATTAVSTDPATSLNASPPLGAKPTDALPQGMQALAQAEAPDAQTLAALSGGPAEGAAEGGTPTPLATDTPAASAAPPNAQASAARPANSWRGQPPATATHALQQTHHDAAQADRLQVRVHTEVAAAVRSTVALDERFASSVAMATTAPESDTPLQTSLTSAPAIAAAPLATGGGGTDLSGQPGGDGDGSRQAEASEHPPSDSDADAEPWVDEDWAQAQDSLDAFAAPTLRQASLRVGDAGEDAIDIQLSMNGQSLDLGFRTDNADARAALARHAESSLAELLQRGGIQLGDVSVGSHSGQSAGGQGPQPRSQPPSFAGHRVAGAETSAAALAPLQPRRDGNRPLDLFV